jgi:hypothetical protein
MDNAADENWQVLVSLFPPDWEEQARKTRAIWRQRGITDPGILLRIFLLHVAKGYSLRETSVRAGRAGLAAISDVGLLKRLRRSELWLHRLCVGLWAENGIQIPAEAGLRRVRIVDGTIVKEPGKTGSQWRILYSLRLPELRCDFFELTPTVGEGNGESFARVPVGEGDLLLGDAGYGSASGVESVVARRGDVLVRINPQVLVLENRRGRRFDLLGQLQELKRPGQIGEWRVRVAGTPVNGRVCAVRKSDHAIRQAHRRIQRRASKRQTQTQPETWEYAKYVAAFTTIETAPASSVLEWYRIRWQVELVFKRLKSLAQLGHLPKYDEQSSRAWLYGKLFVALLTQKLIRVGRDISPWGYELAEGNASERVARV